MEADPLLPIRRFEIEGRALPAPQDGFATCFASWKPVAEIAYPDHHFHFEVSAIVLCRLFFSRKSRVAFSPAGSHRP
jgi:hypothetical protein